MHSLIGLTKTFSIRIDNMNKIRYSILFLTLILSTNALSTQTDTPDKYAYGAEIELSDSESMFSKVVLDNNIYTQTISPTLNDVRIFNRNGQIVPFTLVNEFDRLQDTQKFDMIIYPLNQVSPNAENNNENGNYAVSIQGKDININVDRSGDKRGQYIVTYLLQLPANSSINAPISNLQLLFSPQDNWQATANIAYSSDLKYWDTAVNNVPIMTLTNNDDNTLILNDVSFQPHSGYKSKNWLITLYSQSPIPILNKAIASSQKTYINNTYFPINFSVDSSDEHTIIYSLPTTQPVKELTIDLNNSRSVLPTSIYYKKNATDKNWIKLDDRIIRKTEQNDEPAHFTLNNQLISQIKLETINSSFEQTPSVIAYRNKVDIIFNSANNAPFILAWGSATAMPASLNQTSLLSPQDDIVSIPFAYIGKEVKLSGEKALNSNDSKESSGFPKWIIWLGLIAGAGVLVLLAIKLAKEIKKQ